MNPNPDRPARSPVVPVPTDSPIVVSVLEDDSASREAVAQFLGSRPGFRCLETFGNLAAIRTRFGRSVVPQVLLVDLRLPDGSGVEVIRELRPRFPDVDFVVLTAFADDAEVFEALRAGANGYLLKSESPEALLDGIRSVRSGGSPMSPSIARKVIGLLQSPPAPRPPGGGSPAESWSLTPREHQMLEGLAQGLRYCDLAERHGVSIETVRFHLRRIYTKLHVHSRTEAVAKYVRGNGGDRP